MAGFTPVSSMIRNELADPIGVDQVIRKNRQTEFSNELARMAAETDQVNASQFQRQNDLQAQRQQMQIDATKREEYRQTGLSLLGWLDQNQGRPEYAQMLQQLAADPESQQAAGALGIDLTKLSDPAYRAVANAKLRAPVPEAPVTLKAENIGGFRVLRDSTGKVISSQAPERPGSGAEKGPNKQLVTRPTPDGRQQDYAFNPQTSQLEPVGDPYAKTAPLSPKDTTTAKQKLTQITIAKQQLKNAKAKFQAIRDSLSAGAGGGLLPTPAGKAFDAAIDGMRGSITALTRVPGVGAMSDYETRLDQAKFPTRNDYEDVIAQKLEQLDALINGLDTGYRDLLGGTSDTFAPSAEASQGPRAGEVVDGYRFKGGDPSQPSSWVKVQ